MDVPRPQVVRSQFDRRVGQLVEEAARPVVTQPGRHPPEDLLQFRVVHRSNRVDRRSHRPQQRLDHLTTLLGIAEVRNRHVCPLAHENRPRKTRDAHQLIRRRPHQVTPCRDDRFGVLQSVHEQAPEQLVDRMKSEREVDDDAEVTAAAAQGPEQLLVLARGRAHDSRVGGDDGGRDQVVERQAVHAQQVPDSSAEREPGHAGVSERPARRREPVPLTRRVEILPQRAAPASCRPCPAVDPHLTHQTQVDHDAAVADAETRDAVTTTADRHRQACFAGELDRGDYVGEVERPRHDRRATVTLAAS